MSDVEIEIQILKHVPSDKLRQVLIYVRRMQKSCLIIHADETEITYYDRHMNKRKLPYTLME
jgi:hypothetical protein